jgi:hypothetical protein
MSRIDGVVPPRPWRAWHRLRRASAWMFAIVAVGFSAAMGLASLGGSPTTVVASLGLAGLAAAALASLADRHAQSAS